MDADTMKAIDAQSASLDTVDRIPTIDIAPYLHGDTDARVAVAYAIGSAAERYGFALIVGHDIPAATIADGFDAGRSFFALPEADKLRHRPDRGRDVLGAMALHLGTRVDFFDAALVDTYSHMRINHYPPHETVAHVADEGVFAHHDESLITLLLQDENSGLQVMGRGGAWLPVAPNPRAVVVNVGKMLRHWTGGRYNAALHQVINHSGRDRYSIPLFVHPSFRTVVDPRDLIGDADDGYAPIVAGEAVQASFASTRASWQAAAEEAASG